LQDHNQQPFADQEYELRVDAEPNAEPRNGKTDAKGKVLEQVAASTSSVKVTLPKVGLTWRFALNELVEPPSEKEPVRNGERQALDQAVRAAQMRLNALGFPCGQVDGALGPKTRAALALAELDEQAQEKPHGEVALAAFDKLDPMFNGVA
jgi:hypothetical protein